MRWWNILLGNQTLLNRLLSKICHAIFVKVIGLLSTETFSVRRTIVVLCDLEDTYDIVALVISVVQELFLVKVFLVCIMLIVFFVCIVVFNVHKAARSFHDVDGNDLTSCRVWICDSVAVNNVALKEW